MPVLLYADSFDHYTTSELTLKWQGQFGVSSPYTAASITTAAGVKDSGLLLSHGANVYKSFADTQTVAFGFAFRPTALTTRKRICSIRDEGTIQLALYQETTGRVSIVHGNGSTIATSSSSISSNQWCYLELYALISDTLGAYNLRMNGTSEVSNGGSADTKQSSNERVNILNLGDANNTSIAFHYDNLYINDGTLWGPIKVGVLRPNGGVPNYMQMSVVGAGSHYQAIDDTTPDFDTTYVYSAYNAPGSVLFSEYEDMGDVTGGAIFGAAVHTMVRKEYGNTRGFQTGLYPGTADAANGTVQYYNSTHYVEVEPAYHSDYYTTNPGNGGGTWTVPSIKELRGGFRRII